MVSYIIRRELDHNRSRPSCPDARSRSTLASTARSHQSGTGVTAGGMRKVASYSARRRITRSCAECCTAHLLLQIMEIPRTSTTTWPLLRRSRRMPLSWIRGDDHSFRAIIDHRNRHATKKAVSQDLALRPKAAPLICKLRHLRNRAAHKSIYLSSKDVTVHTRQAFSLIAALATADFKE